MWYVHGAVAGVGGVRRGGVFKFATTLL